MIHGTFMGHHVILTSVTGPNIEWLRRPVISLICHSRNRGLSGLNLGTETRKYLHTSICSVERTEPESKRQTMYPYCSGRVPPNSPIRSTFHITDRVTDRVPPGRKSCTVSTCDELSGVGDTVTKESSPEFPLLHYRRGSVGSRECRNQVLPH